MVLGSSPARLLFVVLAFSRIASGVLAQPNNTGPSSASPPPVDASRCFLSLGRVDSEWLEVSGISACADCHKMCSELSACYNYIWSSSLDCHAGNNTCSRSVLTVLSICMVSSLHC